MGFIDYHGTKEDRYTEVLEYARAQQKEDWKLKEEHKMEVWLRDLTGSCSYAKLNAEDLIKYIVIKYRSLQKIWTEISGLMKENPRITAGQLWKDFSLDMADRHLSLFHLTTDKRNKYLQTFQTKVFCLTDTISAEEHYQRIASDPAYRQYYVECFDPTWKGQHFFKWIRTSVKKNPDGKEIADDFLETDIQLSLFLGLYLHEVIMPHDDSWMHEIEAERKALTDIRGKTRRGTLFAPDLKYLINPMYVAQEKTYTAANGEKSDPGAKETQPENGPQQKAAPTVELPIIPDSGLNKEKFNMLINKGGISNYVESAIMLMECDLPEDIAITYRELIERMPVLQDAVNKYSDIYQADMDQFEEYFAPEALRITAVYLEYQAVNPSEKILQETREGVFLATRKLLQVVNEKIDEIYRFVTMDANAEAKALEDLMNQDGHVNPEYRIR